jgi:RNA polymerase sigma-70 factor (ECF subfamily)
MMTPDARQAALTRAREGDATALGELLGGFRPYVQYLVRASCRGRASTRFDDSDLTQDAILLAHKAFSTFRGATIGEFTVWLQQLTRTAINRAFRTHRDAGKRDVGREEDVEDIAAAAADSHTPSASAVQHECAALVAAAVDRLPADMREVVLGKNLENLSYAQLAERMARSEGALRVLYTRALRKLREDVSISFPST